MEPLSKLKNKDAIVVIVDQFSNIIRLKATMIIVLSEKIVKIYWDKIWKQHERILSDRGPQFASKFIEDLTKILGMKNTINSLSSSDR